MEGVLTPVISMDMKINPAIGFKQQAKMADNENEMELRKACNDFEAVILRQMLKLMRETVPKDGLFGNSYSQQMFEGMRDDVLADELANSKGLGLGELLYQQLSSRNNE